MEDKCTTVSLWKSLCNARRLVIPSNSTSPTLTSLLVLALSALHLAYFKPDRRDFFLTIASAHHQTGLRLVNSILPHIDDDNCASIYIFSSITSIFTLASPRAPDDFLVVGESGIAEWLSLFRGVRAIIEVSVETLTRGPLGPIFTTGARRYQLREDLSRERFAEGDILSELAEQIRSTATEATKPHLETYATAIHELEKSFSVIYKEGVRCEPEDVFIWLFRLSDEYLMLLKERTQEALVIFAFFCVIPKRLEANWWIDGWSTHLMTRIHLLLDNEHRLWVRWPMEEMGWVPS